MGKFEVVMTFICAKIVTKMTCDYAVLVLIWCRYSVLIHQLPLLYTNSDSVLLVRRLWFYQDSASV